MEFLKGMDISMLSELEKKEFDIITMEEKKNFWVF